jgi:glycosyltransferase involved in cell wall biosynthesis/peptidoglycan/xylan/chitin deacetylase (PgdA/CDA1 family)
MFLERVYYKFKYFVPRPWILRLRRYDVSRKRSRHTEHWPIEPHSVNPPKGWAGWPDGKEFALVLTHDVESSRGLDRCLELAAIEERYGFRSSFNFVPGDYSVPESLRNELTARGFEIGIHGLHHKDNSFRSENVFKKQAAEINRYLKDWNGVGFRSPSMYHNLDMLHYLDIEYDASTFDTDPFEPQPDGMRTIFPFWVPNPDGRNGYIELPYTLPQDFLLFILMQEKTNGIWEKKLDWITSQGGMALVITHPDYLAFRSPLKCDEYPVRYYEEFLSYIKNRYRDLYWQPLPKEVTRFWKSHYSNNENIPRKPIHVCMPVYSFYKTDNRVMRYAEALAKRGDCVEILALGQKGMPRYEEIRGVKLYRIQNRNYNEKNKLSFLLKLMAFFIKSSIHLTKTHFKNPFDLIHVHSVPDFEVFATVIPKLKGAKVILDIHDIVPEFYASKFQEHKKSIIFKTLAWIERLSCKYSDHVIISNHIWQETLFSRSVEREKCTVIMNYPDEALFSMRLRKRNDDKFILIYPGTLAWHQGLDIAIKAFALIKDMAPKSEFHIYGRGPEQKNISKLIEKLDLKKRVILKDTVPLDEVASIMAEADLGIVPKRDDPFGGEAFSTKILEFMSLGIPVIVAETRIDKFYFNESIVKFFKPDDINDLAHCMISLIRDKNMRARLAHNALTFVADFSWEKKRAEYLSLVDGLISANESTEKSNPAT